MNIYMMNINNYDNSYYIKAKSINNMTKTIALMHKREEETYFLQRYEQRNFN